jgi:hypothetical protein
VILAGTWSDEQLPTEAGIVDRDRQPLETPLGAHPLECRVGQREAVTLQRVTLQRRNGA